MIFLNSFVGFSAFMLYTATFVSLTFAYANHASQVKKSLGNIFLLSLLFYIICSYWLFITSSTYAPDFQSYTKRFEYIVNQNMGLGSSNFEPGFYYYVKALGFLGVDKDLFLPISTFILVTLFLISVAFANVSFYRSGLFIFCLLSSNIFLDLSTNTIRQGFSTVALLICFFYFIRRKPIISIMFGCLAISFHISAILCFLLLLVSKLVPSSRVLVVLSFITFIASILAPDLPRNIVLAVFNFMLPYFGTEGRLGVKLLFYKNVVGVSLIDRVLVSWELITIGALLLWFLIRNKHLTNYHFQIYTTFYFFFSSITWTDYPFRFYAIGIPVLLATVLRVCRDVVQPPKAFHMWLGMTAIFCFGNSFIVFWRSGLFAWY